LNINLLCLGNAILVIRWLVMPILCLLFMHQVPAQGSLVLIGGGSENDDPQGWNRLPYQWAVDQSANKRVVLISFNNETNWLPDYFLNHLGALEAKNIRIHSAVLADAQATYDSLMSYDVLFLKGGDQYNYYNTYKGTKTAQALQDKFNQGGVICGTSAGLAVMSEVVFTAANGTVYPDECLENPNNSYVQLANDFLSLIPGVIFDSHFNDRGRLARLAGFLAHWQFHQHESITGIGLDERTAMVIDTALMGKVFGTGAATILRANHDSAFTTTGTRLGGRDVTLTQLVHQCTIDLRTSKISGLTQGVIPVNLQENRNYTLFFSGDNSGPHNIQMLQELVNSGESSDTILIVCGNTTSSNVTQIVNALQQAGGQYFKVYEASINNLNNSDFSNHIATTRKFLFVANEWYILDHFLSNGSTGPWLRQRIMHDSVFTAFAGSDSRFAGAIVIDNHLMNNAANNGNLMIKPGLGLLRTTVILPEIYLNSNMYVNGSGVPYVMIRDEMANGILLYKSGYIRYHAANGKTWFTAGGNHPVQMMRHSGCTGNLVSQTSSSTSSILRQIAGFDAFEYLILNQGDSVMAGDHVSLQPVHEPVGNPQYSVSFIWSHEHQRVQVSNPRGEKISVQLFDLTGKVLHSMYASDQIFVIPWQTHTPRVVVVRISHPLGDTSGRLVCW
jgi:cyanophycinase